MDTNININLNEIVGMVISKTTEFYKINSTNEEIIELVDELLKDKDFLSACKNIISVDTEFLEENK